MRWLYIVIGASTGALCRYGLGVWAAGKFGSDLPYGTWIINMLGSFVLGVFLGLHLDRGLFSADLRYLIAVGWCASFTTYSTFSWETLRLLEEGQYLSAGLNVTGTLLGCLLVTWLGLVVARSF